jgi:hypothetical protein
VEEGSKVQLWDEVEVVLGAGRRTQAFRACRGLPGERSRLPRVVRLLCLCPCGSMMTELELGTKNDGATPGQRIEMEWVGQGACR